MSRNGDALFDGIKFDSGSQLTTDASKLNFQAGTVAAAGGLIKSYQDKEEANKLANFNNALLDMTNKGDVDGLKQLASYADQFKDAEVKQKAYCSALGAFDTTASTVLLNEAEQAFQGGDLTRYQDVIAKAQAAGLAPTTLNKVQTTLGAKLPELKVIGATKDVTNSALASIDAVTGNNRAVFEELYAANPKLAETHDLVNGQILKKDFNPQDFAASILAKNGGKAPADLNQQVQLAQQTFAINQDAAEKGFYSAVAGKKDSLKDVGLYADNAGKELTQKLIALGIPLDKASASGLALSAQLLNKQQLGAQGQKRLSEVMAADVAAANNSKAILKGQYEVTQKLNDAEIQQIIEQKKFGTDDLFKKISEIDPSGNWTSPTQNKRSDVTTAVQKLLSQKIDFGNGVPRNPTMFEIASAIDISKDSPWWTSFMGNRTTLNTSDLLPNVKLAMQNNAAFNKTPITDGVFQEIKDYVTKNANIDAALTEKSLRATRRLNAESGIIDSNYNSDRMQQAIGRINQSAPATDTTTVVKPMSTNVTASEYIQKAEGIIPVARQDGNGITLGKGHQITSDELKQGFIQIGDTKLPITGTNGVGTKITADQAEALFQQDLPKYEGIAKKPLGAAWDTLNKGQQAVLTSYAYNVGNMDKLVQNGLVEKVKAKDFAGAAQIIEKHGTNTVNGEVNPGLVKRRAQDAAQFAQSINLGIPKGDPAYVSTSEAPKNTDKAKVTETPATVKLDTAGQEAIAKLKAALPAPKANVSGGNKNGEVQDRKDTKAIKTAIQATLDQLKSDYKKSLPKVDDNPFKPRSLFESKKSTSSQINNPNAALQSDLEDLIKGNDISLAAYTKTLKQYGLAVN